MKWRLKQIVLAIVLSVFVVGCGADRSVELPDGKVAKPTAEPKSTKAPALPKGGRK